MIDVLINWVSYGVGGHISRETCLAESESVRSIGLPWNMSGGLGTSEAKLSLIMESSGVVGQVSPLSFILESRASEAIV